MRLVDEYEWVPQMRHFQALFVRYRHAPDVLSTLQNQYGLRRVADSDHAAFSAESALLMSEWLHGQRDPHAMAWIAHVLDLGAGDGVVYYLRAHSTLALALAEIKRLSSLFFPDAQFFSETFHGELRLSFLPYGMGNRLGVLLRYEAICVWMMRVIDEITGGKATLRRMEWMNAAHHDLATLQEILPFTPALGSSQFRLVFDESALDLHLPGASENLRVHLAPMYDKRIAGQQRENTVVQRVARWLGEQEQLNNPRLDSAAQALNMGSSTLRRQLAQEGCSFSEILSSHRACIGIYELIHGEKRSEEIAQLTGYADRNTFERAFRDWFGITPAHCRRAANELLGSKRHADWSSPTRWARHAPDLAKLKHEIGLVNPDWEEFARIVAADPVLHARVLGCMALPAHGAQQRLKLTAQQLSTLPRYVLTNFLDASTPLSTGDDANACEEMWSLSHRAATAAEIIGPALGCDSIEPILLAASCLYLGYLACSLSEERHIDGIDVTWLLLASWHVPPSILHLLRLRHHAHIENSAVLALALANDWAKHGSFNVTAFKGLEGDGYPPDFINKLESLMNAAST